jgi:hypothetical protein
MSLGLYDYERRRRRRILGRVFRFVLFVGLIGGAGAFAYQTGVERVEHRVARRDATIAELESRVEELERDRARLAAATRDARRQHAALAERYERDVPTGAHRELAELVGRRLAEGIDAQRLAFFIAAAAPPEDCAEPVSRAFFMPTPLWNGANTSARFAEGRIVVTGLGENSRGPDDEILAPFDPQEEVTITFTLIDGEEEQIRGLLPLHHAIVLGGEEVRFAIAEGQPSMVAVTAERCAFP